MILILIIEKKQANSKQKVDSTMTHITKHDTKLEGESDNSEQSRVYFLIPGNSISIYNLLERGG
jgi:hypothetical protein